MTTLTILPPVGRKTSAPRTCLTDSDLYLSPVSQRTGLQHNQTHAPPQTIMALAALAALAAAAVSAAAAVAAVVAVVAVVAAMPAAA